MTGGDIFLVVANNKDYQEMAREDKIFSDTIQKLADTADDGDQEFAKFVVNMAYNFQNIYMSLLLTIIKCGDESTIESVNALLLKSFNESIESE